MENVVFQREQISLAQLKYGEDPSILDLSSFLDRVYKRERENNFQY